LVISIIALIVGSVALSRDDKSKFMDIRSGKSWNVNTKICHILSDDCTKNYASHCDGNVAICYHVKEEANNSQSSSLHAGHLELHMSPEDHQVLTSDYVVW
jgi:hypothetical protein